MAQGEASLLPQFDFGPYWLDFHVRNRNIGHFRFSELLFLGGGPVGSQEPHHLDAFFRIVLQAFPQRAEMLEIPGHPGWERGLGLPSQLPVHSGVVFFLRVRRSPGLPSPPLALDFPDYLAQFPGKKRYNLRRQVRILRDQGGDLKLHRIEHPEDVPFLLDALHKLKLAGVKGGLSFGSPSTREKNLQSVARQDLSGVMCS